MLTVDISLPDVEELHKLVAEGREKGFLSYDEIASGLEDVQLTKEQAEDFYTYLVEHGVDVVEGERHKAPPPRTRKRPSRRSSTSPSSRRSTPSASICARSARCRSSPPTRR